MYNNIPSSELYKKILEWLQQYHSTDSVVKKNKLKSRIVLNMIPVVKKLAKTIARRSYDPIDDLVQAGSIGLLKAIEKFSTSKNNNFQVYAGYLIIGEIKHYIRDKSNCIHVPAYIQELTVRINNFTSNLTYDEVQMLTSEDVASALDIPKSTVDLAILADRRKTTLSLDALVYGDNEKFTFEDFVADNSKAFSKVDSVYEEIGIALEKIVEQLPDTDKILFDMYYNQNMNQKQISEAMQMNRMTVFRHLKQAVNSILKAIEADRRLKQKIQNVMDMDDEEDIIDIS